MQLMSLRDLMGALAEGRHVMSRKEGVEALRYGGMGHVRNLGSILVYRHVEDTGQVAPALVNVVGALRGAEHVKHLPGNAPQHAVVQPG